MKIYNAVSRITMWAIGLMNVGAILGLCTLAACPAPEEKTNIPELLNTAYLHGQYENVLTSLGVPCYTAIGTAPDLMVLVYCLDTDKNGKLYVDPRSCATFNDQPAPWKACIGHTELRYGIRQSDGFVVSLFAFDRSW